MIHKTTKTIASWLGALIGIGGINHGIFEMLQGSTPTPGLLIQAIGPMQRYWLYGTEEAFTIVPNFLVTGILAVLVGAAVIIWSLCCMHRQHAATVFILLCILLFLVGGGIGQVVFFTLIWLGATRIHGSLNWWKKALPEKIRPGLARVWPVTLGIGMASFLFALEIAVFGLVPGLTDPDQIFNVCWASLGLTLVCIVISFISGFARDIMMEETLP